MIVRAAVKIMDLRQQKEICIPCHRHCDAFQILAAFGYKKLLDYKELAQGFLDEHDNFLTRQEAARVAENCGQLLAPLEYTELYSEDLW